MAHYPMVQLTTGCKINLFLHIGSYNSDGYHSLDTVFFPLSKPCDSLTIEVAQSKKPHLTVRCSDPSIDTANNTLTKAFSFYTNIVPLPLSLSLTLKKNVPHGAGLGGGSANAAGLLLFLQDMAKKEGFLPLSNHKLFSLASNIGADVPFFLLNETARASGIGEILTPYKTPFDGYTLLLVCPDIHISTPWAFKELDAFRKKNTEVSFSFLTSSSCQDISFFSGAVSFQNDFEEIVFAVHPRLAQIKKILLRHNATYAMMSGTGSSLFGIFKEKKMAQKAVLEISEKTFIQEIGKL